MTGPCFLGSSVSPVEPYGKSLLLPLQCSQNRLSLGTLQQTAAFRISGQEKGEKRRKASESVRCYFRIRSSILGDSEEVVCEGLNRKTLKGWQYGLVGKVCLRSVSKYGASSRQLRLPSQRPGGKNWLWATAAAAWGGREGTQQKLWKEFCTVSITTACQPCARSCQSPGPRDILIVTAKSYILSIIRTAYYGECLFSSSLVGLDSTGFLI